MKILDPHIFVKNELGYLNNSILNVGIKKQMGIIAITFYNCEL